MYCVQHWLYHLEDWIWVLIWVEFSKFHLHIDLIAFLYGLWSMSDSLLSGMFVLIMILHYDFLEFSLLAVSVIGKLVHYWHYLLRFSIRATCSSLEWQESSTQNTYVVKILKHTKKSKYFGTQTILEYSNKSKYLSTQKTSTFSS